MIEIKYGNLDNIKEKFNNIKIYIYNFCSKNNIFYNDDNIKGTDIRAILDNDLYKNTYYQDKKIYINKDAIIESVVFKDIKKHGLLSMLFSDVKLTHDDVKLCNLKILEEVNYGLFYALVADRINNIGT